MHAVVAEPDVVGVARRCLRGAQSEILCAPRDIVAEPGNGRGAGAREGLDQAAVRQTVPGGQPDRAGQLVLDLAVELVDVVALDRRGDIVREWRAAIRERVEVGDRRADLVDEERRQLAASSGWPVTGSAAGRATVRSSRPAPAPWARS